MKVIVNYLKHFSCIFLLMFQINYKLATEKIEELKN